MTFSKYIATPESSHTVAKGKPNKMQVYILYNSFTYTMFDLHTYANIENFLISLLQNYFFLKMSIKSDVYKMYDMGFCMCNMLTSHR